MKNNISHILHQASLLLALRVAPKKGEALGRKPGAHTLKLSSTVWAAELRDTDACGGS